MVDAHLCVAAFFGWALGLADGPAEECGGPCAVDPKGLRVVAGDWPRVRRGDGLFQVGDAATAWGSDIGGIAEPVFAQSVATSAGVLLRLCGLAAGAERELETAAVSVCSGGQNGVDELPAAIVAVHLVFPLDEVVWQSGTGNGIGSYGGTVCNSNSGERLVVAAL